MSQSAVLVGLLAAGFLLYLAARGRVSSYTSVLWGPASGTVTGGADGDAGHKDKKPDVGDFAQDFAGKFLPYPYNLPFQFN